VKEPHFGKASLLSVEMEMFKELYFYGLWELPRHIPYAPLLVNRYIKYPPFLEVEVTTRCNLKCTMCEHTYWDEPGRDMPFEKFKFILDQFPNLKWIGLTGIGESFLHEDFIKMLRLVRSRGILVELYDTMFYVDNDVAKELVKLGIYRFFFSLDAATEETYKKIRIGSNFDRVVGNIVGLAQAKGNGKYPRLAFHYIITKDNVQEIPEFVNFAYSLLPGNTTATIQFSRMLHTFKEVEGLYTEVSQDIIAEANIIGKRTGMTVRWGLDVPEHKPPMRNCIEWIMPFIFVDGTVIPCCAGNEGNKREYQREASFGNIFEKPFSELWSTGYKDFRGMLRKGQIPAYCRRCPIYEGIDSTSQV